MFSPNFPGFVSMHSLRSSIQSGSTKRSSEQSVQSSKSASMHSSEFSTIKSDSIISSTSSSASAAIITASNVFDHSATSSFAAVSHQNRSCFSATSNSSSSTADSNLVRISDIQLQMKSDTSVVHKKVNELSAVSIDADDGGGGGGEDEPPPALPVKTRSVRRHDRDCNTLSQYDNVDNVLR